ncbi:MAG: fibronectin type III domain-containing protein, partial [Candidatus Wallbacteria bacterium]|nr:fibronectin type III domain-containing protein [Candidatus Wallbacteria bacterium]
MDRHKLLILLGLVPAIAFFLIFGGCEEKNSDLLTVAFQDDGQAPQAPVWAEAQPEYLYSNESPNPNTRYFAVYLRWEPVKVNVKGEAKSNIVSYKIYRDNKDVAVGVVEFGCEEFEDFDLAYLQEGKRISYYISAVDSNMRETFSGPQMVDLMAYGVQPQPPMNFYLISGSGNQVTLSWNDPENTLYCKNMNDEVSKYRIQKRTNGEEWKTVAMVPFGKNYYIDEGLSTGNTYYYRLYAITTSGNASLPSDERSVFFEHRPDDLLARSTAPENVKAEMVETATNPYAVRITWQSPIWNDDGTNGRNLAADVVAYRIYRAKSGSYDINTAWGITYTPVKVVYNNTTYL